jgi:hypothetical protein
LSAGITRPSATRFISLARKPAALALLAMASSAVLAAPSLIDGGAKLSVGAGKPSK